MKRVLLVIGILFGLLVLCVAALPFLIDANRFRPLLESELTRGLGRPVKLGDLKLALLSGAVTASDLSIADDPKFSKDAFLSANSLGVSVDLIPLIVDRKLNVKGITIDHPSITLLQAPGCDHGLTVIQCSGPSANASGRRGAKRSEPSAVLRGERGRDPRSTRRATG